MQLDSYSESYGPVSYQHSRWNSKLQPWEVGSDYCGHDGATNHSTPRKLVHYELYRKPHMASYGTGIEDYLIAELETNCFARNY